MYVTGRVTSGQVMFWSRGRSWIKYGAIFHNCMLNLDVIVTVDVIVILDVVTFEHISESCRSPWPFRCRRQP